MESNAIRQASQVQLNESSITDPDIQIHIVKRDFVTYRGTSAQLTAEGLIPDGFKWPSKDQRREVKIVGFEGWMSRIRPEGHKGPKGSWIDGDFWILHLSLDKQTKGGFFSAEIYAKQIELADAIYRGTREWQLEWQKAYKAKQDEKYMAFRNLVIPEKKRGRGRPSNTTIQSSKNEVQMTR